MGRIETDDDLRRLDVDGESSGSSHPSPSQISPTYSKEDHFKTPAQFGGGHIKRKLSMSRRPKKNSPAAPSDVDQYIDDANLREAIALSEKEANNKLDEEDELNFELAKLASLHMAKECDS